MHRQMQSQLPAFAGYLPHRFLINEGFGAFCSGMLRHLWRAPINRLNNFLCPSDNSPDAANLQHLFLAPFWRIIHCTAESSPH
jgi:hypothetical protein